MQSGLQFHWCSHAREGLDASNFYSQLSWTLVKMINICDWLCQNLLHTHTMAKKFSSSINSSINKLTNYHNTTAKYFFWGLFLKTVRCLWVLGCPLNATGWLPPCWKSPNKTVKYSIKVVSSYIVPCQLTECGYTTSRLCKDKYAHKGLLSPE